MAKSRLNGCRTFRVIARVLALILAGGSAAWAAGMDGQFIYAAQDDGTLHVYDINNGHSPVKSYQVFTPAGDVRGACASAATHRFYIMYNLTNSHGYVACVDLLTDQILWNTIEHSPGVDRGQVTPNGNSLFIPTWEADPNSPYALVVDALTGNPTNQIQIPMPTRTHDTICTLDGTKVFMSNKSSDQRLRTISTASNAVISVSDMFSGLVQPFAINGSNTFAVVDVAGTYGIQYVDLVSGHILGTALFTGTTWSDASNNPPHGIGMTPDEHEAWACDVGTGNHYVHVFDITTLPAVQTHLITVSHDYPWWLTFSIDGRFCYVAGQKGMNQTTDVIDTSNYTRVASLSPSQDLLEVDFSNGTVTRTGDQFGIGRLTNSSPQPPALTLSASTNGMAVSWPAWAGDYSLMVTANLSPPAVWAPVTNSVSSTNGINSVSAGNNGTSGFYRLQKP